MSEVTYYRWRQEFGGLNTEQVKRLKEFETENSRLRKAVSDLTLDKLILQGGRPGSAVMSPEIRDKLKAIDTVPVALSPSDSVTWLRTNRQKWTDVITKMGIRAD